MRWGAVVRALGILVGVAVAWIASTADPLGLGATLAVPLFGTCLLLGLLVAEALQPRPARGVRRATLETRRIRDYLPRRPTIGVAVLAGALVAVLGTTTAVASPDSEGRAGRELTLTCPQGFSASGPWPGSYYAVPTIATVLCGLGLAALVLRAITARPRLGPDDEIRRLDDAGRRQTARMVVASCGLLVAVPLAGTALVAAPQLAAHTCGPGWLGAAGLGLAFVALGAFLAFCAYLAQLVLPPREPTDPRGR